MVAMMGTGPKPQKRKLTAQPGFTFGRDLVIYRVGWFPRPFSPGVLASDLKKNSIKLKFLPDLEEHLRNNISKDL